MRRHADVGIAGKEYMQAVGGEKRLDRAVVWYEISRCRGLPVSAVEIGIQNLEGIVITNADEAFHIIRGENYFCLPPVGKRYFPGANIIAEFPGGV